MVLIAGAVTNLPDGVVVVVFGFDADVAFIAAPELLTEGADFEPKDMDVTWY